jgi:hypothetical protein
METRRNLLKGMAVGAAACSIPGGTAYAAQASLEGRDGFLSDGAAPWWLIAPLTAGSPLAYGWYVGSLGKVARGASVLTLKHSSGRQVRLHLCGYDSNPRGIAHTGLIDLVLMDGGFGDSKTGEHIGRIVLGIAKNIANNELDPKQDLYPIAKMLSHEERKALYGPESL